MAKILVLYVFHEFNNRVKHFIDNCIFYDVDIDFIIISNNKSITIEVPGYVKTFYRENIGYDFGGWSDALLTNNLYTKYEYFIFLNSSTMGPFLPSYYTNKWTDIYINGLKNNVKLFGSTINTMEKPLTHSHVQSYIFSMNKETLKYLIECEIFSTSNYVKTYYEAIFDKEIKMSRKIIENKWNIGCLLTQYKDVDFTFSDKKPEQYNIKFIGDVTFQPSKNVIWTVNDVVFVKGNRIRL